MGPEQIKAMNEQVQDLLNAEIIQEIQYQTWVANPGIVAKSNGYHQIRMAVGEEDKTAFRTNQGTFCYKMTPFGLKNARETYQRLMDEAFKEQIGHNLKVYMDDLVIKSVEEEQMLRDIEETFNILRRINMKLNPSKCLFGMEEGKFLGVIVTSAGFKANPDKVQAVARMPSPSSLKESVLSKPELSGRLAKWAIELGEHSIEYKLRPAIKGQVLADFIRGSSAGLRLVNPKGHEFTYAIKLVFKSTNNEAEYEAFLEGLRIAIKLGVKHLEARVDSMLIAGHINRSYQSKNDVMASYLSQEKDIFLQFSSCKVIHIKRSENKSANASSKLASTNFEHFAKDIRIEVLDHPSVPQHQVMVIQMGVESWMTPIIAYLSSGTLPKEKSVVQTIRHKALNYQVQDGVLYLQSFFGPILRCVGAEDANYLIREVHEGICDLHSSPRMVVAKLMNAGYYWPGMHMDTVKEIGKCDLCQRHAPNTLRPKNELVPVTSAWPFQK
ncbi:uncharacterized protein LOC143600115 [Bidens hawaiensis]|uniref:uncharacterized protein LOC143600115 n=1 Tax=Bidens hawaiensis TaxID=980011 RepID=UPI004049F490